MSHAINLSLRQTPHQEQEVKPIPVLPEYEGVQSEQPNAKILRFQQRSDSKCMTTPSGLAVLPLELKQQLRKIGTIAMSSGVHHWDIIVVQDTKDLHIGVIKDCPDIEKNGKVYSQTFNASTMRTITVQIDFNTLQIDFYLNGNLSEKKSIVNIPKGVYYPVVVFSGSSKVFAINPFVKHTSKLQPQVNTIPGDLFILNKQIDVGVVPKVAEFQLQNISSESIKYDNLVIVGGNFIYFKDDKMKLIRPQKGQLYPNDQIGLNIFRNNPKSINDVVELRLHKSQFEILIKNLNWEFSLQSSSLTMEQIEYFNQCISQAKVHQETVLIESPFILFKQVIASQLLSYQSSSVCNYIHNNPTMAVFENLKCIHALLQLDEQLYAMEWPQKHSELSQFMNRSQFSKLARIYSQFYRLFTFLDSSTNPSDPITMVENGLLRLPGFQNTYRHFINCNYPLETIPTSAKLHSILPQETIFNVLDIPLHLTINSMPYVELGGNCKLITSSNNGVYISTINENGLVTIWNAEIALQPCFSFNIREYKETHNAVEEQECHGGDLLHLFQNGSEQSSSSGSDQEKTEEVVEANQDLLNQMYNMGFSLEVSKQALIKVKNVGLEQALDVAVQLQEQKQKEQIPPPAKVSLKMNWICGSCTFVNTNENFLCAVCEQPPGEDAFAIEAPKQVVKPVISEEEQLKIEQAQQEEMKKKLLQAQREEQENFMKQSKLTCVYQASQSNHSIIIVGCFSGLSNKVVFKRLQYAKNYIAPFIKQQIGTDSKVNGFVELLGNTYHEETVTNDNVVKAIQASENGRFIHQSLYPVMNRLDNIFELEEQCEIEVPKQIQYIHQVSDSVLQLYGKEEVWRCELFKEALDGGSRILNPVLVGDVELHKLDNIAQIVQINNDYYVADGQRLWKNNIQVKEYVQQIRFMQIFDRQLIIQLSDSATEIVQLNEELQDKLEQKQEVEQQQLAEVDVDLINLTADEISNLAKLNEKQSIYFTPNYIGNVYTSNPNSNNSYANVIVETSTQTSNHIQLSLTQPSKIMQLKLTAYVDEHGVELESNILNLVKSESVPTDMQKQLPLTVYYHVGAQFNSQQQVAKTCFVQIDPFTSLYGKPEFIYKHLQNKRMIIQQFIVSSPLKPVPMGQSLQSGLVFIADDPNDFQHLHPFHCFNSKLFEEWKAQRTKNPRPLKGWEPIAYFELQPNQLTVEVHLEIPVKGKYILMKPLSARGVDQKIFEQNSLAFNHFIVIGSIAKEQHKIVFYPQSKYSRDIYKNVQIQFDGQPVDLNHNNVEYSQDTIAGLLQDAFYCILPCNELVQNITIDITQSTKIHYLKIEGLEQTELNSKFIQKIPNAATLSQLMHDDTQYDKFNIKLMKLIHNPQATLQQRISCIKVMCTLFQNNIHQIIRCSQDFNCLTYLKLNVISQNKKEEPSIQAFLNYFHHAPNFIENLSNSVKEILNNLYNCPDIELHPVGFSQLIFLLKQLTQHNPQEYFPYILGHLKQILKCINKSQDVANQSLLKAGVFNFVLEESLFSEKYTELVKSTEIQDDTQFSNLMNEINAKLTETIQEQVVVKPNVIEVNPKQLVSIIKFTKNSMFDTYEIDLLTKYDLTSMSLIFGGVPVQPKVLRIQLWSTVDNQCILDTTYPEWMATQLTKYADLHKQLKIKQNVLRFSFNLKSTRKLTLKLSYSHCPFSRNKEEAQNVPKDLLLIPEFSGQLSHTSEQSIYQSTLSEQKYQESGEEKFLNSQTYHRHKLEGVVILDSAGTFNKNFKFIFQQIDRQAQRSSDIDKSEQVMLLKGFLQKAQKELKDRISKGFGYIVKEQLDQSVNLIKKLQLEILKHEALSNAKLSSSLDFLHTYAYDLIDTLIATDKNNKEWRGLSTLTEDEGLKLVQLLYNSFIVTNNGLITQQTTELVNILLDNMKLKHWINFCFLQYNKLDQQKDILSSLTNLQIPISQTILYISHNCNQKASVQQISLLLSLLLQKLTLNSNINEKELIKYEHQGSKLQPPGTVRSTSSQDTESLQNMDDEFLQSCYQIDQNKVFHASFCILTWILEQQNTMNKSDAQFLFNQAANLFLLLKNDNISKFVMEICNIADTSQSQLANLITNAIMMNDPSVLKKLKEVIDKLQSNGQECIRMIFYTTQCLLASLVDYAQQDNGFRIPKINTTIWFTYVCFLSGQLLQSFSSLQSSNPGSVQLQRKRSTSTKMTQQIGNTFAEFCERLEESNQTQPCQYETFMTMLSFLTQNPKNLETTQNLSTSLPYWGLIMNLMQKLRPQQIIDQKIFEKVLIIYFNADSSMHQVLFSRFLDISKTILDSHQVFEINSLFVSIILDKHESCFQIADSFLTLAISKDRKLHQKVIKRLFEEGATYLMKSCNMGRNDGIQNVNIAILKQINFGNKLIQLLTRSECPIKVQVVIQEIPNYGQIIYQYIHWFMINRYNGTAISPSTEALINISKSVKIIFEWLAQDVTLCTQSVIQLYKFQRELDSCLQLPLSSGQMGNNMAIKLVKNTQEIFEELNELWMTTDQVVREVAIKSSGFEYLLEKTHLTQVDNSTNLITPILSEAQQQSSVVIPNEEEFANKMSLHEAGGAKCQTKDWQVHKKGVKTKLYSFNMKDDSAEEHCLDFELERAVELKQIRIGFQVYTPEFNDKVLGFPTSIVVEIKNKSEDSQWYPLGEMTPIEDEAYIYYSIRVMALSACRINCNNPNLQEQIRNLCHQPVTWVRFIVRRPQITFLEQISQLSFKQYNQVQIGVSFISITGYDTEMVGKCKQIQILQEQTASRLLGKMCASKFRNTLQDISKNQKIVEQIKKSFGSVSNALQSNESTLAPLFIGMTKYNPEFGDWVLSQLFDIRLECAHAKLSAEIVLQDDSKRLERLKQFITFVIGLLGQMETLTKNATTLTQLALFVEALIYSIHMSAKQLPKDTMIALEITQQDIDMCVNAINVSSQFQQSTMIIKLLVTLITLPQPYQLADQQLRNSVLISSIQSLYQYYKENTGNHHTLRILTALIQLNAAAMQELLQYIPVIYETAYQTMISNDHSPLLDHFFFLDFTANIAEVQAIYRNNKYHLQVYEGLKVQNSPKQLIRTIDAATIPHIVSFIGKCVVNQPESIKELALILISDINLLSQIVDINYVESILMPLLNYEHKVDFTLDIWDKESQAYVGDIRKLSSKLNYEQEEELQEQISSAPNELNGFSFKEFSKANHDGLLSAIQKVVKSSTFKKGGKWVKEMEMSQNAQQQFNKALGIIQKGPFLILLQGKNGSSGEYCTVGLFSTQSAGPLVNDFFHDYYPSEVYPVNENGEQFGFAYENDKMYHLLNNDPKAFGVGMEHENGGSFSFLQERVNLTFSEDQQDISSVSIGVNDFELLEQKPEEDYYFDDFWLQRVEIWSYQQPQQLNKNTRTSMLGQLNQRLAQDNKMQSTFGYGILASSILQDKYFAKQSVYNFFSATPVYSLPAACNAVNILQAIRVFTLTLSENAVKQQLSLKMAGQLQDQVASPYVKLEMDGIELLNHLNSSNEQHLQYNQVMPIFTSFQAQDGVKQIILTVTNAIKTWSNQELSQTWSQYIEELNAFCSVPQFFSYYLKNRQSMELLFQLLAGVPDQQQATHVATWKDKEMEAVKFIYDTLSEVFRSNNNSEIRLIAISDNLIQKILDRIAIVAKEKKRTYHENLEIEDAIPLAPPIVKKSSLDLRANKKKQGVGYGSDQTGQNQKWNTQEYLDKKKIKSEQLRSLLDIIRNFFNYENWHLNNELAQRINTMMFESALLPMLEAAFRSGSLLEMSKDWEINLSYLNLTKTLTKHKNLAPLLMKIPDNYQPRQTDSIATLLDSLRRMVDIFLSCLTTEELSEKDQISKNVAQAIIETNEHVQEVIQKYEDNDSGSEQGDTSTQEAQLQEILKLPLAQAYRILLQDLRFDYISLKNANNQYVHFYERYVSSAPAPTPAKLIRLAQEFADMSNSLPVEHTNAIFVRVDKERVDVMKAMVMGASGTPYAHGAYVFDIYFDESYPGNPPKVNLATTGSGKIRFNPNLYACGKVCLSLLGTWRGHASENWDPKLSTLLQVLVSTQAIIMSEDVYFNEPGFEGEAGTPEGDAKNEAYSNIVRYGNVMFAMIEQIKNPPEGFEGIVRRHFYLKRYEIMEEVSKWVEYAHTRSASYVGLVSDHNCHWCSQFKKSKPAFYDMLKLAVAELDTLLNGLQPPSTKDMHGLKGLKKQKKRRNNNKQVDLRDGMMNLDDVDVTYDVEQKQLDMDVTDEGVKDRWSRYIGAMGIDAVQKQGNAKVLLHGVGALGIEIAKNMVLSGVKQFALHDNKIIEQNDLIGQFFLEQEDIGKCIGKSVMNKLQQLNNYVRVILVEQEVQEFLIQSKYDVVILTNVYKHTELVCWSNFCRAHGIKLIVGNVNGVFARIINDFGEEFTVIDKNGEEYPEVMIKSISTGDKAFVQLLQGQKALFEDGDTIMIENVDGMVDQDGKSINGIAYQVKTINHSSFQIGNTSMFTPYIRNGTVKHIKTPVKIKFKPLEEVLNNPVMDPNMMVSDFMKLDQPNFLHLAYKTMSLIEQNYQVEYFIEQAMKLDNNKHNEQRNHLEYYLTAFEKLYNGPVFPPLAAYLGGFISQEVIKAITNKYTPINQIYYTDCFEVLPYPIWNDKDNHAEQMQVLRDINENSLLGAEMTAKLEKAKIFMVGCGAIGCELLKNFAMLNIGVQGQITITDPDHIETSNLNRQFLFREKHIHKSKSQTAAATVIQMNPRLKNKIIARQDKVHEATENIYNDKFYEELSLVANALDNVQARRYVDARCVKTMVPLLESGTLGPKGHVQCIIPHQTESYGSMNDPVEENEIPYCTLKMFPEETLHCVEFARDKFSKLFCLKPKSLQVIWDNPSYTPTTPEELKQLRESIKLVHTMPQSYEQCLKWARHKFQKYFINDIKQLMYTYPLDTKTKDGKLFWTQPKKPPTILEYEPNNKIIAAFVSTLAYLKATIFGIVAPPNWRQQEVRTEMAQQAATIPVGAWVPNDEKRKVITEQVGKMEQQKIEQQEDEQLDFTEEREQLLAEMRMLREKHNKQIIVPQEFEKDNDQNGHVDFMHAFGNLRAMNYKLHEMDWLTVKLKVGRIVPALATTTAVIAGLQTIELVKTLKQVKLEHMKNAFINLAVPILSLTEPGTVQKIKLNEEVSVTLWDRWEVRNGKNITLLQLFEHIRNTYKLEPVNLFYKSSPIYTGDTLKKHEQTREKLLHSKIAELINFEDDQYVDVVITLIHNEQVVQNVPEVRIYLKE